MTVSRDIQINLENTPYYHCISRCVRRAFLCGKDYTTGKDFDHRKGWIVKRIKYLASIFSIQICAYAIMSNHYHLVLFVDSEQAEKLTEEEVFEKWQQLCPQDAEHYEDCDLSDPMMQEKLSIWRERFTNISWFMKFLNENISKQANKEDECTGRFWESRFKSQALLDESAVLMAMAYVDLNPIRAGIATTPESSEFTSIYERIKYIAKQRSTNRSQKQQKNVSKECDSLKQPPRLMSFSNDHIEKISQLPSIDFKLSEYLQIVDMTGRMLHEGKKGTIPISCANILERLNLSATGWMDMIKSLETKFSFAVGDPILLSAFSFTQQARAPKGLSAAKKVYLAA